MGAIWCAHSLLDIRLLYYLEGNQPKRICDLTKNVSYVLITNINADIFKILIRLFGLRPCFLT